MSQQSRHLHDNFASDKNKLDMPPEELSYKFFKAHILMGMGTAIGAAIADTFGHSYPLAVGLLTGLLFSIHLYRQCVSVLIEEYKRLKTKKDEKNNIS